MDAFLSDLFLREIQQQCEFARSHYNDLNGAVAARNVDEIFRSLQSFLVAAANISKIFFPARDRYEKRGEYLRNLLSIDENSQLAKRYARDFFEHFDERLDNWYEESPDHNLLDMSIGESDSVVEGQIDYIRYFNKDLFFHVYEGKM
jgi:hypothetical protein